MTFENFVCSGETQEWLNVPAEERKDVSYTISFSDADTGIWDGKGLRFAPGGAMKLVHTYIYAYMHACMHTYIHTYPQTHTHTHTKTSAVSTTR